MIASRGDLKSSRRSDVQPARAHNSAGLLHFHEERSADLTAKPKAAVKKKAAGRIFTLLTNVG